MAVAGAFAVLVLLAGPAGAQTSGGAVATNGSVASGDAHADNNSTASGDATAHNNSTASGDAHAHNNSTASGCSEARNNSTASGGECGPAAGPAARVAVPTGGGGGGTTARPAAATTARPAATAGRLAVTGDFSSQLAGVAAFALALGMALVYAGSDRRRAGVQA